MKYSKLIKNVVSDSTCDSYGPSFVSIYAFIHSSFKGPLHKDDTSW